MRAIVPLTLTLTLTLALALSACGLTVTNDRPTYEELNRPEQQAVDIIFAELKALDLKVRDRTLAMYQTPTDLSPVVDRRNIDVTFKGMMLAFNVGDGQVHVASWENLTEAQRGAVQQAFRTTPETAAAWYRKLFYRVLAVSQGVKQYMFNLDSAEWAYTRFSVFNMELHPLRTAMSYFAAAGRKADIWPFTASACGAVLSQNEGRWGHMFTKAQSYSSPRFPLAKAFMLENHGQFIGSGDPTVNLYFLCQWARISREEAEGLDAELGWLHTKLR